jgi:hypothetical protein
MRLSHKGAMREPWLQCPYATKETSPAIFPPHWILFVPFPPGAWGEDAFPHPFSFRAGHPPSTSDNSTTFTHTYLPPSPHLPKKLSTAQLACMFGWNKRNRGCGGESGPEKPRPQWPVGESAEKEAGGGSRKWACFNLLVFPLPFPRGTRGREDLHLDELNIFVAIGLRHV